MCILRIAAVIIGLAAIPVLFASAETLSTRAREAGRQPVIGGTWERARGGAASGRLAAASESLAAARARGIGEPETTLTPQQSAPDRKDVVAAPTFARIVIDPNGASSFEGSSTPGAEVTLSLDTQLLGKVYTDKAGVWRLTVAQPMAAGDHNITSSSKSAGQSRDFVGQEVRIAIPDVSVGMSVIAYEAPIEARREPPYVGSPESSAGVRDRAEQLAAAASRRFTEIAPPADSTRQQVPRPDDSTAVPANRPSGKLVQAPNATTAPSAGPAAAPKSTPGQQQMPPAVFKQPSAAPDATGLAGPVVEWLERSAREYQGTVIKGLSEAGARAEQSSSTGQSKAVLPKAKTGSSGPGESGGAGIGGDFGSELGNAVTDASIAVQEWLARANRSYQTEVVRKLEQPATGSAGDVATRPPVDDKIGAKSAVAESPNRLTAEVPVPNVQAAETVKRRADEARQIEDERRSEATRRTAELPPKPIEQVKPLTEPPTAAKQAAADDATKNDAEAARQKAVEALRQKERADEAAKKSAEDARRKADEAARQKAADEASQRAAEAKRIEDARRAETSKAEANKAEAGKAADLARKAIDAARTAPAKRADEQQAKAQPAARQAAPARTEAAAKDAAKPTVPAAAPKSASRPKDSRIAEGSGEKGPVDKPAPLRGKLDQSARSGLGVQPAARSSASSGERVAQDAVSPPRRAQTCGRAGREITPPGTYVVAAGDTLSEIAERHYGTARRMQRIVKANRRKIGDPDLIRPCQRIYLP